MYQSDLFNGQTIVVTGGGTGIGLAIAKAFGRLGAHVAIGSRKPDNVRAGADALAADGLVDFTADALNIRDRASVEGFLDRLLEKRGRIDGLINNAGGQFACPAEGITPNGWHAVVETNLYGPWNMIQTAANRAFIPNRHGRIVNITMANLHGFPGMVHSAAARAGVNNLTMTLAVEWAKYGIRLNTIALGTVDSSGLKNYPSEMAVREWAVQSIPLQRLVKEEEVAALALYLASPLADAMTGAVIPLDGGEQCFNGRWPLKF